MYLIKTNSTGHTLQMRHKDITTPKLRQLVLFKTQVYHDPFQGIRMYVIIPKAFQLGFDTYKMAV